MTIATRRWQMLIVAGVGLSMTAGAWAASGRQLAIGRAFSYAYNNPQQQVGQGPLGSTMYSGGPPQSSPICGVNTLSTPSWDSPLSYAARSNQAYTPMAPVIVERSGPSYGGGYTGGAASGNPVRELASALADKGRQGPSVFAAVLTSLAPNMSGPYRSAMLRGESEFRKGNYKEAIDSFQASRELSNGSAESWLSLSQAGFAMGESSYNSAANCLAQALKSCPDLPLIRVRPREFFGSVDAYNQALANLERFAQDHPKDASALFLLGYMQWREGQVDKALQTLDAAMGAGPEISLADGIAALLDGISRSGQAILAGAPSMQPAQSCPWAGIALALPDGFKSSPLTAPNMVLEGIVPGPDASEQYPVTLYAYSLSDSRMTLDAFMDFMIDPMRKSPAITNLTSDAQAEVPFQTGRALVRLFTYTNPFGQDKYVMGWVAFDRELKNTNGMRIAYMLGVVMHDKQADKLLPTLAAIAKTVALSDPASPSPATITTEGSMIEDAQAGFSIVLPHGWSGQPTNNGFEMGQLNFASANAISPKVDVIVQAIPGTYTPKSFGEEAIQRKVPKGQIRKVLSEQPATLCGQEGYQFTVSQSPDQQAGGPSSILVGRLIFVDVPDGQKKMYALVVECRDAQAKDVQALTDKMADNLKILKLDSPATGK
jgi:tetratricopeptide (TPR) repeat protein